MPCHKQLCPACKVTPVTEPANIALKMHCTTPSVGYRITCLVCKTDGRTERYEGETGRPLLNRGVEHVKDILGGKQASPLVKHILNEHPDKPSKSVKFEFEVLQKFRDPLTRQAEEGVRISHPPPDGKIINSKAEFNHPKLARITIRK